MGLGWPLLSTSGLSIGHSGLSGMPLALDPGPQHHFWWYILPPSPSQLMEIVCFNFWTIWFVIGNWFWGVETGVLMWSMPNPGSRGECPAVCRSLQGEGRVGLDCRLLYIIEESRGKRSSRQKYEGSSWNRDHRRTSFSWLPFHGSINLLFYTFGRGSTAYSGIGSPTSRKCPTDTPTAQSDGGSSSAEGPSSKVTPICIKWQKWANTVIIPRWFRSRWLPPPQGLVLGISGQRELREVLKSS